MIKQIILSIIGALFICADAPEVIVSWSHDGPEDIAGYKVYYGEASRSYSTVMDVGNRTSAVIREGLVVGNEYYSAVTSYFDDGSESGYSNELIFVAPDPKDEPYLTPVIKDFVVVFKPRPPSVSFKVVVDNPEYGEVYFIGERLLVEASANFKKWEEVVTITYSGQRITINDHKMGKHRFYRVRRL